MELRECLDHLLGLCRERTHRTPKQVLEYLPHPADFRSPTQLTGFQFDFPTPFYAILVTHSSTAPDAQITCHEGIRTWETLDVFQDVLDDALWDDEIPDHPNGLLTQYGYAQTLRGEGQRTLLMLHHNVRYHALAKPPDRPDSRLWAQGDPICMVLEYRGLLEEMDITGYVDEAFKDAKQRARDAQKPKPPRPPPRAPSREEENQRYRGRGAFHAPGLQIGRVDDRSLQDLIRMDSLLPGWKVFDGQLGGHDLLATHNGFLGLVTSDDGEALHWLNLLMAAVLSKGYPARAIREQDLARFHPPDDDEPGPWGGTYPAARDTGNVRSFGAWDQYHLELDDLEPLLRDAEAIADRPFADQVPVFLEAYSHLVGNEPTQSFVFSWALIEQQMTRLWDAYLRDKEVSARRRKRLEWSMHLRAEALQLAGWLDTHTLNDLRKVRDARNAVMHGNRQATESDAGQALDLAERLITGDGPALRGKARPPPWEAGLVRFL